jgi:RNA polymerase sigma-70 factor, ECF subfamily
MRRVHRGAEPQRNESGFRRMTNHADNHTNGRTGPDQSDEDWSLIRLVGTGDRVAFERLYKRFYSFLYRFVFQITRQTEYVDEVINETMFVVWEKAAGAIPRAKASTWILGIAHNKALQVMYRAKRIGHVAFEAAPDADLTVDEEPGLRELETEEMLFRALRALTPEQRAVMELVYYHGLHYSEIADLIGCPENTVKTRVFHARRKLRSLWPALNGNTVPGASDRGGG